MTDHNMGVTRIKLFLLDDGASAAEGRYRTNSLSWASTTGQGSSQCLSVIVTMTFCPTMWYSPLAISWEKRPDRSSPSRVALFSKAAFLALASSEGGVALCLG